MKKIVISSFLILTVVLIASAGQALRWYTLKTPSLFVTTFDGAPLDLVSYGSKYKNIKFDPKKTYYYQSTVQTMYSRGTFPFASVKVDTTSTTLQSRNYFNE